jgi:hypothetical protein
VLRRYEVAEDSYQQVLGYDANNAAAIRGLEACERELLKIAEHQRRQQQEEDESFNQVSTSDGTAAATTTPGKEAAPAEAQGGGGDGVEEEEDLLADFFDEVEEAVNNKKKDDAAAAAAAPPATNAIRNDRAALGTAWEQVDRLLQPRYEWRTLNPYFVLQLPAATSTDEDISRRYKALSLLLHPDKNQSQWTTTEAERDRAQLAYDQVQKGKIVLTDPDRKRYTQSLVAEGMKQGEWKWAK